MHIYVCIYVYAYAYTYIYTFIYIYIYLDITDMNHTYKDRGGGNVLCMCSKLGFSWKRRAAQMPCDNWHWDWFWFFPGTIKCNLSQSEKFQIVLNWYIFRRLHSNPLPPGTVPNFCCSDRGMSYLRVWFSSRYGLVSVSVCVCQCVCQWPVIFGVYLRTLFRFLFLSLSSLSHFLLFFHWLAQALSLSFFLSRARANPFLNFSIQMHIFSASNLSHLVHVISLSHTHIHMHMHATCT